MVRPPVPDSLKGHTALELAQALAHSTASLFGAVDMEPADYDELTNVLIHRAGLWMAVHKDVIGPEHHHPVEPDVIPPGLGDTLLSWAISVKPNVAVTFGYKERPNDHYWSFMSMFGREAPDSPMAGGSTLGMAETLAETIEHALAEGGVHKCATCGWTQTCEDGCHS